MRRSDRAVHDLGEMERMLAGQTVCRVALKGEPYPYVVPLNYGFKREGDRFTLYFHCAPEGRKLELLDADPRVAFVVDGAHSIRGGEAACSYTMHYESVMGEGILSPVEDEAEMRAAFVLLMRQVAPDRVFDGADIPLGGVRVLRLTIESIAGKRHAGRV